MVVAVLWTFAGCATATGGDAQPAHWSPELAAKGSAFADRFEPLRVTEARVMPISDEAWVEYEPEVIWYRNIAPTEFRASDYIGDALDAHVLAQAHTEDELLAKLGKAAPMYAEYPVLLGALYLKDPVRGRQRIIDHLRARPADPDEGRSHWAPGMSSLVWLPPEPFDDGLLDAVACVIRTDPGMWFQYAYFVRSAKKRGQAGDVAAVVERLPKHLGMTLEHYAWLMDRTAADIEADLAAQGIVNEHAVGPELRGYVDGISHWTPMDRWQDGAALFPELWPRTERTPSDVRYWYEALWSAARAVAPVTLRNARLGWLERGDEGLRLVLEKGSERWFVAVSAEAADEAAGTALLDKAVAAGQPARFRALRSLRNERFGLIFGDLEGFARLTALYRLDEPDFNLLRHFEAGDLRPCEP